MQFPLSGTKLMHAHLCRGFQLLAKMGYREGEGIGKSVKGRAAPIDVSLKSGRTGLGIDEERKRKKEDANLQQTYRGAHFAVRHLSCCWHRAHFAHHFVCLHGQLQNGSIATRS